MWHDVVYWLSAAAAADVDDSDGLPCHVTDVSQWLLQCTYRFLSLSLSLSVCPLASTFQLALCSHSLLLILPSVWLSVRDVSVVVFNYWFNTLHDWVSCELCDIVSIFCCTSLCVSESVSVLFLQWLHMYSVSQKSSPPKTFCDVFPCSKPV